MKAIGKLGNEPRFHQIVVAYCSDHVLITTLLLPHGISPLDSRLFSASLDHSIYFHRPFRADEWLLYEMNCTVTSAGRGLAFGRFFDKDGRLVVSTVQEGLIRIREKDSSHSHKQNAQAAKL